MSIRRGQLYFDSELIDSLWVLARTQSGTDEQGLHHIVTADEMAEIIVRKAIETEYRWLLDLHEQQKKLEREVIKAQGSKVT